MHISFLTSEYPHPNTNNGGGIATSIKNLAVALSDHVEAVTVFVVSCKDDIVFYDNKVRIVCLKAQKYKVGGWYFHRKYIEKRLNNHIEIDKIDIIEAADWTGLTAFMKLKCPVVIKIHGSDTYFCHLEKRPQKWKNRWYESLAFENADAVIGVSKFALEVTNKLFKIKANIPQTVIYNGIDISQFKPANDVTEPIVLYFGTLIRKKGCLELPLIFNEVVRKIPNAKLVLAGHDSVDIYTGSKSTWSLMQPLFSNEALKQTEYVGKLPYTEMQELISKAAVCVFPSYAETFGLVNIESMAMEKTIICADMPWVREIVDHNINGYYEETNNINSFSNLICNVLSCIHSNNNIGKAAREKVLNKFNIVEVANQNLMFYQTIINQ